MSDRGTNGTLVNFYGDDDDDHMMVRWPNHVPLPRGGELVGYHDRLYLVTQVAFTVNPDAPERGYPLVPIIDLRVERHNGLRPSD